MRLSLHSATPLHTTPYYALHYSTPLQAPQPPGGCSPANEGQGGGRLRASRWSRHEIIGPDRVYQRAVHMHKSTHLATHRAQRVIHMHTFRQRAQRAIHTHTAHILTTHRAQTCARLPRESCGQLPPIRHGTGHSHRMSLEIIAIPQVVATHDRLLPICSHNLCGIAVWWVVRGGIRASSKHTLAWVHDAHRGLAAQ